MKKRKGGFTLTELLAVIVVLAIIIMLASTSVISVVNKARTKTSLEMRETLKDAALIYTLENIYLEKCSVSFSQEVYEHNDISNMRDNTSCIKSVSVATLKNAGLFEDNRGYCSNEDEVFVYRYYNGTNSEYKAYVSDEACMN